MENGLQIYNTTDSTGKRIPNIQYYNTGKRIPNIQCHIQHWKKDSKYTIPHTTLEIGFQIYNTTYNARKRIPNIQYHIQHWK